MTAAALQSFVEKFQLPGKPLIEPARVAAALELNLQDLANLVGVHRSTLREAPNNVRIQNFMRDVLKVIAMATEISGDETKAIFWFKNEPIRDLGYVTAEKLVSEGKADAVAAYLQSIESGASG